MGFGGIGGHGSHGEQLTPTVAIGMSVASIGKLTVTSVSNGDLPRVSASNEEPGRYCIPRGIGLILVTFVDSWRLMTPRAGPVEDEIEPLTPAAIRLQ